MTRLSGLLRLAPWLAPFATLTIAGCGDAGTAPDVAAYRPFERAVELSPGLDSLLTDDTVRLVATVRDRHGVRVPAARVFWSSLAPGVADVSDAGVVRALAPGTAKIVAGTIVGRDTVADTAVVASVAPLQFGVLEIGDAHSCGVTLGGQAYCWGSNLSGELGGGPSTAQFSDRPVPVAGGLSFRSLALGSAHSCGLTTAGAAYCWGSNGSGRLGVGSLSPAGSAVPLPVAGGLVFTTIAAGDAHTCALTPQGDAYCWGTSVAGALGLPGGQTSALQPTRAQPALTFASLASRNDATCGITSAGQGYCWGGSYSPTPTPVATGASLTSIVVGRVRACGLQTDGTSRCWQHGVAPGAGSELLPGVKLLGLAFGGYISPSFTCALPVDGHALCTGENSNGELGDGTFTDRFQWVPVSGGVTFRAIRATYDYVCALAVDRTAYCWGQGFFGRLGAPYSRPVPRPVRVTFP